MAEYTKVKTARTSSANYATRFTQTILANRQTVTGCGCSKDALSCDNCKWLGKRHQKCSCCRRNHGIKDNYEGKMP